MLVGRKQRAKARKNLALRHLRGHQAVAAHAEHGIVGLLGCQAIVINAEPATPLCKIPSIIFSQTFGLPSSGLAPLQARPLSPQLHPLDLASKRRRPIPERFQALPPLLLAVFVLFGKLGQHNCPSGMQSHTTPLSFFGVVGYMHDFHACTPALLRQSQTGLTQLPAFLPGLHAHLLLCAGVISPPVHLNPSLELAEADHDFIPLASV